jgi:hypothetical protein
LLLVAEERRSAKVGKRMGVGRSASQLVGAIGANGGRDVGIKARDMPGAAVR